MYFRNGHRHGGQRLCPSAFSPAVGVRPLAVAGWNVSGMLGTGKEGVVFLRGYGMGGGDWVTDSRVRRLGVGWLMFPAGLSLK